MLKLLYELKNKGNQVKVIRCDNAGENLKLKELCDKKQLNIKFKFTAPGTPQQNGVVERKFATLFGRARAMLNKAGFKDGMRNGLWAKAASAAMLLNSISVKPRKDKCSYKLFFGDLPKWIRHLRMFGEVGIVKDHKKIKSKLENRGCPAMFAGYP